MHRILLILLTIFAVTGSTYAQTTDEDARDDLDYYNSRQPTTQRPARFSDNLWYGAGAQLGFSASNRTSIFFIGVSPIVGYKLNNFLSVGPRGSFVYNRYTDDFLGIKDGYVTWELGAFTRANIFRGFFAHAEYSFVNEAFSFDQNTGEVIRTTRAIPFIGGGLSQGGGPAQMGFEILILFRITQADRLGDSPFQFRTGLNYNF